MCGVGVIERFAKDVLAVLGRVRPDRRRQIGVYFTTPARCFGAARRLRAVAAPRPAKPSNIIAQVDASGIAVALSNATS